MPTIRVEVKSAQRTMEFGGELFRRPDIWRLYMDCEFNRWEETIRLSTGEDIVHVAKSISFVTIDPEKKEWLDEKHGGDGKVVMGLVHYFPAWEGGFHEDRPATVSFEVFLTQEQMSVMLELACEGRFPKKLRFDLADDKGMKYGWEPDGSGKDWDTKQFPRIPIEGLSFQIPIIDEPSEEETPTSNTPPTPVGADILPVLNKIAASLGWVVAGVALLVGLAIYRH